MDFSLVELAKRVPMSSVFEKLSIKYPEDPQRNFLCPLPNHVHTKFTGSFRIYEETNTFGCFGCRAGGSVVNFVMHYKNIGFTAAIDWLNKEFSLKDKNFLKSVRQSNGRIVSRHLQSNSTNVLVEMLDIKIRPIYRLSNIICKALNINKADNQARRPIYFYIDLVYEQMDNLQAKLAEGELPIESCDKIVDFYINQLLRICIKECQTITNAKDVTKSISLETLRI